MTEDSKAWLETRMELVRQLPGLNVQKFQVTDRDRVFRRRSRGPKDGVAGGIVLIVGEWYGIASRPARKYRDLDSGEWMLETIARPPSSLAEARLCWNALLRDAENATAHVVLHDADDAQDFAQRDEMRRTRARVLAQLRELA